MKALVAFIVMAVVILALIEINERRKAHKAGNGEGRKAKGERKAEDCTEACSECGLLDVCEKGERMNG